MREPTPPRRDWRRLAGSALTLAGLLGLLLSGAGLLFILWGSLSLAGAADRGLARLDEALVATDDGLAIAGASLEEAEATLGSLSDTVAGTTAAISQTLPTLGTLQALSGQELPQTIGSTREALGAAEETARVIDRLLGTLSGVGLLGAQLYNPEVPLSQSIGDVSASLEDLPAALADVSAGLAQTSAGASGVAADLREVSADLEAIRVNVAAASDVVVRYRSTVADLREGAAGLRQRAPWWIAGSAILGVLLMIWLALAQLSLLLQGRALIQAAARPGPQ